MSSTTTPSVARPPAEARRAAPLVEVRQLTIRYPRLERVVLDDISFGIAEGEATLLLGPTGSGKSTLALTLNGIVPQSIAAEMWGEVRVAGLDTVEMPLARLCANTAIVFQDPESQSSLLRVDEEVAFGLENLGVPAGEIGPRVAHALRLVGAEALAGRRLDELSSGELQRVALAAALVVEPRLLVLDEPTAYLDPAARWAFFRLLARHGEGTERTVLVIEHQVEEALDIVGRALVLDGWGRLRGAGPLGSVMSEQADALAAAGIWLPAGVELALAAGVKREAGLPLSVPAALESPAVVRHLEVAGKRRRREPPAAAREVALRAVGVSYGYHGRQVVHGIDLALQRGQLTALVGANGSGKSTLLLGLAGLLEPLSGRLEGRPGAMVFQNPEHQFVARTVVDEIAYGLRARGDDASAVTHAVERTLERFGLDGLRHRNPFALSQGEKRRLSVAAMTVLEPSVLLLDEPTFGLDRRHAFSLLETLAEATRRGAAICVVSHDLRLVAEYADRVIVLGAGRLRADGPPQVVFADGSLLAANALLRPALVEWWLEHPELQLSALMRAARLAAEPEAWAR